MTKAVVKGYAGVVSGLGHGIAACLSGVVYRFTVKSSVHASNVNVVFFFHFICQKPFRGFPSLI